MSLLPPRQPPPDVTPPSRTAAARSGAPRAWVKGARAATTAPTAADGPPGGAASEPLAALPELVYDKIVGALPPDAVARLGATSKQHRAQTAAARAPGALRWKLRPAGPELVTSRAELTRLRRAFPSPAARSRHALGDSLSTLAISFSKVAGFAPLVGVALVGAAIHGGLQVSMLGINAASRAAGRREAIDGRRRAAVLDQVDVLRQVGRGLMAIKRGLASQRTDVPAAKMQARLNKNLERAIAEDSLHISALILQGAQLDEPGPGGLLPLQQAQAQRRAAAADPSAPRTDHWEASFKDIREHTVARLAAVVRGTSPGEAEAYFAAHPAVLAALSPHGVEAACERATEAARFAVVTAGWALDSPAINAARSRALGPSESLAAALGGAPHPLRLPANAPTEAWLLAALGPGRDRAALAELAAVLPPELESAVRVYLETEVVAHRARQLAQLAAGMSPEPPQA